MFVKKVTKENVKLELFKVDLKIEDKIVRHATCGDVEEQKRIENNLESLWYQKHCLVEFAKSQGIEDVEVQNCPVGGMFFKKWKTLKPLFLQGKSGVAPPAALDETGSQ